jgi:hypothetical protein
MSGLIDETGNRYGRLLVLGRSEKRSDGEVHWMCKCDCGSITHPTGTKLRRRGTSSCACCQHLRWSREHRQEVVRRLKKARRAWQTKARNSPEYMAKAMAKRSMMPGHQPGEQHFCAKWWALRDPNGRAYEFRNLAKFVRDHSEMFDPADMMWQHTSSNHRSLSCRAYSGLSMLNPRRRQTVGSWKGWTWAATSAVSRSGSDILARQTTL